MMKHDDDKLELLLKMMEHPEKYTEQQLQNMLDDADCRDFYELTVKAEHGYEARRDDGRVDEETLDEEWRRFEATHLPRRRFAEWRQWAAVFIGVLLLSGIALAAIHFAAPRSVRHAEAPARTGGCEKYGGEGHSPDREGQCGHGSRNVRGCHLADHPHRPVSLLQGAGDVQERAGEGHPPVYQMG
jgi:hypothetical protein